MSSILGIDLGLTGAVAVLVDRRIVEVHDLPVVEVLVAKKRRHEHAPAAAVDLVRDLVARHQPQLAVLEALHAMPARRQPGEDDRSFQGRLASGASANFARGAALFTYLTALAAADVPVERVSPQKWKRSFGLGAEKEVARRTAIELFPHALQWLRRVKDHDRSEAILLAEYIRRTRELDAARVEAPGRLRAVS